MDRDTMRKRGWSIQSDQTGDSSKLSQDEGDGDDDDLNQEEKKQLLNNFPTTEHDDEQEDPVVKRPRIQDETESKDDLIKVAQHKLSKWAARLFDPDRPRGLIEAPRTIPLNDEFLTAFGQREKEFDTKIGRSIDVQEEIENDDDASSDDEDLFAPDPEDANKESVEERKVKITNLAYTTTEATLEAACAVFGPIETVNLIMDKEKDDVNIGRGYITFETTQSAMDCIDGLSMGFTLDGRRLRVAIAPSDKATTSKRSGSRRSMARYWEKDISTRCFRCGQVGHMESSCPNAAKPKPCSLCAGLDHDMRACPNSRICFRCGIPGHINRECTYRQNLPKRVVCGICFQSGHHRCSCRRRASDAPSQDAVCFICHKVGHFMCQEMKWFFGLEGITCFNCGRGGHHGFDCGRPGVDLCSRDEMLADKEIEWAETMSITDELEQQMGGNAGQGRSHGRDRDFETGRRRAQSQPPLPRGSDQQGGDRRRSPPPPPQNGNGKRRGYDVRR